MPRRLLLELTTTEARALVVSASESRVTIEKSLVVSLATAEVQAEPAALEQKAIGALVAEGLGRLETIAVVGRADIELRLLAVPPSPDEELPSLVRFQAAQELPNLDADTPLDYLPLGDAPDRPRRVLAAVLKPGVRERLQRIGDGAKLPLAHIVLRAAASASLMLQEKPELRERCFLLVEILDRRVELAAVSHGRVVFLRHVLLSADPTTSADAAESLVSEVRRTRVVVANQEDGQTVEPVVLVGDGPPSRALAERLGAAADARVVVADPLPRSTVVASGAILSPQDRQAATALLGAAADDAAGRSPAFDFLHPRQPPKPPSRRGVYVLAGVAVATLVLALVVMSQLQTADLNRDIRQRQAESASLEQKVKQGDAIIAASDEVEAWLGREVVWLDELRWLSERFPPAQDARLTLLTGVSGDRGRGMELAGLARHAGAKAALDQNLRDATHQVVPKTSEARSGGQYQISFGSSLRIKPQTRLP